MSFGISSLVCMVLSVRFCILNFFCELAKVSIGVKGARLTLAVFCFWLIYAVLVQALIGMISSGGISLLQLGLETLVLILSLSRDTTVLSKVQLGEMAIQLLLAYSQDHVLLDTVKDLIVLMAEISSCMDVLHQRILPVLMNLLSTSVNHASGMLIAVMSLILVP